LAAAMTAVAAILLIAPLSVLKADLAVLAAATAAAIVFFFSLDGANSNNPTGDAGGTIWRRRWRGSWFI
jgi:hypothetical protein